MLYPVTKLITDNYKHHDLQITYFKMLQDINAAL